jgi:hypothetical protein
MPIIKREFYLTDERHKHYENLPAGKRDLVWDDLQDQLTKFIDNHRKGRQSDPEKRDRELVQVAALPEYVATNLRAVANKLGYTVSRAVRNAICDYAGLPPEHIDRQHRPTDDDRGFEYFERVAVTMYDGRSIRPVIQVPGAKRKFKPYFEQWCRNHLGE